MLCLLCGKVDAHVLNLCWNCFCQREKLLSIPPLLKMTSCARCNAMAKGKQWIDTDGDEDAIKATIDANLTVHPDVTVVAEEMDVQQEDRNSYLCNLQLELRPRMGEGSTNIELTTRIRIKEGVCTRCSRMAGNYFEAILQLRASSRAMEKDEMEICVDFVQKSISRLAHNSKDVFLSRIEEMHGGLDFYLGNAASGKSLSRDLAQRFGGMISSSSQMAGKQDGRELYRTTYLVRLPSYRRGDFVAHGEEILWIIGHSRGHVKSWKLLEGKEVSLPIKNLSKEKVKARLDDVKEAVIVSEERGELQVLEPESYKTVVLIKPDWLQKDMDSEGDGEKEDSQGFVASVSLDEELYLVPKKLLGQLKKID